MPVSPKVLESFAFNLVTFYNFEPVGGRPVQSDKVAPCVNLGSRNQVRTEWQEAAK